eukprot:786915-Rhodomonas_salina.3
MSGTDLAYGGTAKSGTDIAYGTRHPFTARLRPYRTYKARGLSAYARDTRSPALTYIMERPGVRGGRGA